MLSDHLDVNYVSTLVMSIEKYKLFNQVRIDYRCIKRFRKANFITELVKMSRYSKTD